MGDSASQGVFGRRETSLSQSERRDAIANLQNGDAHSGGQFLSAEIV